VVTATRQPTGLRVQPLVSGGMPMTAAAPGAVTTGLGIARLNRAVAMVATTGTTDSAAIAAARGGTGIVAAATTPRLTVGRAARAARRRGRMGTPAAPRVGCPPGKT
jgi:hypothetical protein